MIRQITIGQVTNMPHRLNKIISLFITLLLLLNASAQTVFALVTYSYDANGNMTSDGQYCYTYNDANQVASVKNCTSNQLVAEYLYDHQGRRVVKEEYENGTLKQTVYSPDKYFETKKLTDNSTKNTSYYYANDELIARKNPDTTKVFYHTDHLNSTSVLTNENGSLVEETAYYPYGAIRSGGTNSKYLFTGQEKDAETGLYYYGARYYDSHIQRFAQPDPLLPDPYDPQQLNRYAYVRNNPLKYTDPSGNFIFIPAALYVGAVAVSSWATAIASSPDFEQDIAGWQESISYVQENPKDPVGYLSLVAQGITTALPMVSGGGRITKTALQQEDEVAAASSKSLRNIENKINNLVNEDTSKIRIQKGVNSSLNKIHGNDLRNLQLTTGYSLRDKTTDYIVKFGETLYPERRYSQKWLDANNLHLQREASGTKWDMHWWQYYKNEEFIDLYGERPMKNRTNF
ncbi:RHS repeat-associated core domain-containing protein [Candidatus Roizmanbacteria bacterium]|nr:RHS repeat-associated core domain-containing protein [Candidatus Roizmanbacteria bacterium]